MELERKPSVLCLGSVTGAMRTPYKGLWNHDLVLASPLKATILMRVRAAIPFLRPSMERSRERLRKHLKRALGEIRIANPAADEAAMKAAAIVAYLLEASAREAKRLSEALDVLIS